MSYLHYAKRYAALRTGLVFGVNINMQITYYYCRYHWGITCLCLRTSSCDMNFRYLFSIPFGSSPVSTSLMTKLKILCSTSLVDWTIYMSTINLRKELCGLIIDNNTKGKWACPFREILLHLSGDTFYLYLYCKKQIHKYILRHKEQVFEYKLNLTNANTVNATHLLQSCNNPDFRRQVSPSQHEDVNTVSFLVQ